MKIINKIKKSIIVSTIALPLLLNAQVSPPPRLYGLMADFYFLIQMLPRFIFGLSVIYFFWGTGQFILNAGDEKYRADGKRKMVWGIVALTVYASIYGILNLAGQLIVLP